MIRYKDTNFSEKQYDVLRKAYHLSYEDILELSYQEGSNLIGRAIKENEKVKKQMIERTISRYVDDLSKDDDFNGYDVDDYDDEDF